MSQDLEFPKVVYPVPELLTLTAEDLIIVESTARANYMEYGDGTKLAGQSKNLSDKGLVAVAWIEAVAGLLYSKSKCGMFKVARDSGSSEPETEW